MYPLGRWFILKPTDAIKDKQTEGMDVHRGGNSTMIKEMKTLAMVLILLSLLAAAYADSDAPLLPVSPQLLGQGGFQLPTATGWDALFGNPAGFVSPEPSVTFYGTSFWLYGKPFEFIQALFSSNTSMQDFMDDQMVSGGFGFGSADGFGYVGKRIAAAIVLNMDAYVWGATVAAAAGELTVTLAFIGGYAHPFQLQDATLTLGADIRPMIRIQAPIDELVMQDFLDSFGSSTNPLNTLNGYNALHGIAIAIDLGATIEWNALRWGLTIRDFLGTRFRYREDPFGDIIVSIRDSFRFPTGGTEVNDHYIPMDISTGFAYTFALRSSKALDGLVVHWGLSDLLTTATQSLPPASMLHAGAELQLLRRLKLRGGFNQGYLTFGMGVKAWLFDFNLAYFTREMGDLTTGRASSGLTVEAAFRREGPPRDKSRKKPRERKARKEEAAEEEVVAEDK